eukprot:6479300-Amphidinium_carterae.1
MARVKVPSGADREALRAFRQTAGSLNDLAIAPRTRQRYVKAARSFFQWAEAVNLNWERSVTALSDAVA